MNGCHEKWNLLSELTKYDNQYCSLPIHCVALWILSNSLLAQVDRRFECIRPFGNECHCIAYCIGPMSTFARSKWTLVVAEPMAFQCCTSMTTAPDTCSYRYVTESEKRVVKLLTIVNKNLLMPERTWMVNFLVSLRAKLVFTRSSVAFVPE